MKWPTKKSSSSLITRVFPVSWFSKFKQKRGNQERSSAKNSSNSVLDLPSPTPPLYRQGRFYSMDEDDAFWRISFSEDRIPPRRSTGGINPLRHDSDDIHDPQNHTFSFGLAEAEEVPGRNFSEMVADIKKMRERRGKQRIRENGGEREMIPVEPDNMVSNSRKLTKNPLKEIKTKPKSKENNSSSRGVNLKAYSPRTECKIRALEEMKKARARTRKKEVRSVFESFAVVKSSVDPQQDFKESMVEMIREKGIGHPHDLEQLLACYLTLNADQYHDLIITAFRQVGIQHNCHNKNTCTDFHIDVNEFIELRGDMKCEYRWKLKRVRNNVIDFKDVC